MSLSMLRPRHRLLYLALIAIVIALGLASRKYRPELPEIIGEFAGDTLWALMVFLGIGFLLPGLSTLRTAALALLFAFAIETSQLYHAPWIDSIRATTLGHLVLGDTFVWSDFACYVAGVAIGAFGDLASRSSR